MNAHSKRPPIYCIAPSGLVPSKQGLYAGGEWLVDQGYEVFNLACIEREFDRFAGDDKSRLDEINAIYQLPQTDLSPVVMSIRGGYGLTRLLPGIDWFSLACAIEKGVTLVGHSDFTALQIALLAKTGAMSLAGPMLSSDFSLPDAGEQSVSSYTWSAFEQAILGKSIDLNIKKDQEFLDQTISLTLKDKAMLWGGNLTILTSLIGTPYFPSLEQISGGILFVEDVNEHPYRIERMLLQLLQAGILGTQSAVLLGDFSAYQLGPVDKHYDLTQALTRVQDELRSQGCATQLITGLPFGHIADKATLPVGVFIELEANFDGFRLQSSW